MTLSPGAVIWLNDYLLRPELIGPEPALFVFDRKVMRAQQLGLKRLALIHQRLLESACQMLEGDVAAISAATSGCALWRYLARCGAQRSSGWRPSRSWNA